MAAHFTSDWEEVVSGYRQKTALSNGAKRLTFEQLDFSARQVAVWLNERQVAGRCVLILLDDPADSIICMLGVLLSGNYYFYLHEDAAAKSLGEYLPYIDVGATVKAAGFVTGIAVPELSWGDQKGIRDISLTSLPGTSPYFAVFSTSGSTGNPKLVRHKADFILRESRQVIGIMQMTAGDRRDYGGSLMFSASLGAIYPTLLAGAELVLHSVMRTDILSLPGYWREAGITLTSVPVSVLRTIAKSDLSLSGLEKLRLIIVTAEAASAGDMALFSARLPAHVILMNGYATTETRGISILAHRLTDTDTSELHTLGKPVAGKSVYILDGQGEVLAAGRSGEIVVEAPGLPEEYLNDPEATRSSFFCSPAGLPCFRTGDTGYLNDRGYLVLEGRKDAVVKINGVKVNLEDIEKRLLQYRGIREAAAILNESSGRIYAFYSADDGISPAALRSWLSEALSPLHIPARWKVMNALPRTVTGKTDRVRLKAESQEDTTGPPEENILPDDLALLVGKVWKKELELSEEVNRDDDFFKDLGGNSLLAAVCIHEIEELTGLSLPLGAGNTYSTPALLAGFIREIYDRPAHCVPIGNFEAGRPSLYFIPPYPGDRRTYHHLEARLAGAYNLFFLFYNPIDPSGKIVPLTVLTDALADQVSTPGPIHLFGFSFGGIMAYLLAMKLEERNKAVSFLELLDTPLYNKLTGIERAYNLSARTLRKVGQFVQAPAVSWNKYIRHFGTAYKAYRENFTSEKHKEDPSHPSQVIWHYSQTFPAYKPLNAAIVLFTASERGGEYLFRQDFAWQRYTHKNLHKAPLQGWHVELLANEENLDTIRDVMLNLPRD